MNRKEAQQISQTARDRYNKIINKLPIDSWRWELEMLIRHAAEKGLFGVDLPFWWSGKKQTIPDELLVDLFGELESEGFLVQEISGSWFINWGYNKQEQEDFK